MSKYFKRIGTTKFRYQFDILISEASLSIPALENSDIAVIFKRGNKRIESKGRVRLAGGKAVISERMCMLATLYRDKKGKFQEKTATIQVLAVQQDRKTGKPIYSKPVAVTKIDLSRYAIAPPRTAGSQTARALSTGRGGGTPTNEAWGDIVGQSTQCTHSVCLKLLKSADPNARMQLEVKSIYLEEATTMSELSSLGSDGQMSLGESDSDTGDDRIGFSKSNIALRQKAKKLSMQNQLGRQQSEMGFKFGENKEEEENPPVPVLQHHHSVAVPQSSRSANALPPPSEFSLASGDERTERGKSPMLEFSSNDFDEQTSSAKPTPRAAHFVPSKDATEPVTVGSGRVKTEPSTTKVETGGVKSSAGKLGAVFRFGGQSSDQKQQQQQQRGKEDVSHVIRRLKQKNSSLSDTRAAIAAHSRTMLSKALGQKRSGGVHSSLSGAQEFRKGGHSDSSSRNLSISFTVEEEERNKLEGVKGSSPPSGGGEQEIMLLKQKLADSQREKEDLTERVATLTKKNTELRLEVHEQAAEIGDLKEDMRRAASKNVGLAGQQSEKDSLIKKLREELLVQQNVVREVRAKNEAMLESATKQVRQVQARFNEVVERQTVQTDREMEELMLRVAQAEEQTKAEVERQRRLAQELDTKEARILILEKQCAQSRKEFEELLLSFHSVEEELVEQKAARREQNILAESKANKKQKFEIYRVSAKLREMRNLKGAIVQELGLQSGEMQEYSKEISKQLSQMRIEHQLQRERHGQLQNYSREIEQDLMEARMAVGRFKDDMERCQKHVEKVNTELEQSRTTVGHLERDMIRTRQELAESVNVIGEYEKENLELQARLEAIQMTQVTRK